MQGEIKRFCEIYENGNGNLVFEHFIIDGARLDLGNDQIIIGLVIDRLQNILEQINNKLALEKGD